VRASAVSEKHLTQSDLATRWRMSPRTLERWRWLGEGPPFLKLGKGGHVVYRLQDSEEFELQHRRNGSPPLKSNAPAQHVEPAVARGGE
jgi:hypothetical protein